MSGINKRIGKSFLSCNVNIKKKILKNIISGSLNDNDVYNERLGNKKIH